MDNSLNPRPNRLRHEEEVVEEYEATKSRPLKPTEPVDPTSVEASSSHVDYGEARLDDYHQTYLDVQGKVLDEPYTRQLNVLERSSQIIYLVLGLLEVLLVLRFIFKVLGTEASSGLVNFIDGLTNPLVLIFSEILTDYRLSTNSLVEISTLLAMLCYALLGVGLASLLRVLLEPKSSAHQTFASTRRQD